jgi:hypothetical protein
LKAIKKTKNKKLNTIEIEDSEEKSIDENDFSEEVNL